MNRISLINYVIYYELQRIYDSKTLKISFDKKNFDVLISHTFPYPDKYNQDIAFNLNETQNFILINSTSNNVNSTAIFVEYQVE
jgi:hypothetical protein